MAFYVIPRPHELPALYMPQHSTYGTMMEHLHDLEPDLVRRRSSSGEHTKEYSYLGRLDGPPSGEGNGEGRVPSLKDPTAEPVRMIQLSKIDHVYVCQAIGACSFDEEHTLLYTKSTWWPPRGLPDGLYKDVITARFLSQLRYYLTSAFLNFALMAQLGIGAAMTALAAEKSNGHALTAIAAVNTVIAGIIALMHNGGVPDRYKNDWVEFEKVEMFLEEVMYGGIVKEGVTKEQVISESFDRFAKARATQAKNKSATYTKSKPNKSGGVTASAKR
ncbi:hypothetical protein B0O99DRAFT_622356 [Bisporella sp. PMI_857]|nr:hypothetical protein B0O99DRAFT_622356 [Bisporella sp. PMI_857]